MRKIVFLKCVRISCLNFLVVVFQLMWSVYRMWCNCNHSKNKQLTDIRHSLIILLLQVQTYSLIHSHLNSDIRPYATRWIVWMRMNVVLKWLWISYLNSLVVGFQLMWMVVEFQLMWMVHRMWCNCHHLKNKQLTNNRHHLKILLQVQPYSLIHSHLNSDTHTYAPTIKI